MGPGCDTPCWAHGFESQLHTCRGKIYKQWSSSAGCLSFSLSLFLLHSSQFLSFLSHKIEDNENTERKRRKKLSIWAKDYRETKQRNCLIFVLNVPEKSHLTYLLFLPTCPNCTELVELTTEWGFRQWKGLRWWMIFQTCG